MINRRPLPLSIATYTAALLLAALAVGPAFWLVLGAFQSPGADLRSLGGPFTTDNLAEAWREGGLARPLLNSVVVTVVRTALNVLLAAMAAYPLARISFRGRRTVFLLVLATAMIPEQVIVVPMFRIAAGLGLYDTLAGVVIPFSVSAFGVFMCRQAFVAIPDEIEEAARMDGASSVRIWWNVMLPLAAPALATLALFNIIFAWSDLLWPLVILQSDDKLTLPVAINRLMGLFATNPRVAYAAGVLALAPIVLFFFAIQRFLTPQLFAGAVKS